MLEEKMNEEYSTFQDEWAEKFAFVERAVCAVFEDLPNKNNIIKRTQDMPLSAKTVHERTIMMATHVEQTQVKDIEAASFFSLALDAVIARYAAGDTLREESLAVLPIKGSTRGKVAGRDRSRNKGGSFLADKSSTHHQLPMLGADPTEVLAISLDIGSVPLTVLNIYIPLISSCPPGFTTSIAPHLPSGDSLVL
ncbi:unnamed protein product, partial [Dibothriocephalus latus]